MLNIKSIVIYGEPYRYSVRVDYVDKGSIAYEDNSKNIHDIRKNINMDIPRKTEIRPYLSGNGCYYEFRYR